MIRTYGLFWNADNVFWGVQRNRGTLYGKSGPNEAQVDFSMQRGIYALYADYQLVYLGQTGRGTQSRLITRLRNHRNDRLAERWNRFSWFGTQWVTQENQLSADIAGIHETMESALNILEAVSIAISEPRLNLQRGRWGNNVTQYFQVRGPQLDENGN